MCGAQRARWSVFGGLRRRTVGRECDVSKVLRSSGRDVSPRGQTPDPARQDLGPASGTRRGEVLRSDRARAPAPTPPPRLEPGARPRGVRAVPRGGRAGAGRGRARRARRGVRGEALRLPPPAKAERPEPGHARRGATPTRASSTTTGYATPTASPGWGRSTTSLRPRCRPRRRNAHSPRARRPGHPRRRPDRRPDRRPPPAQAKAGPEPRSAACACGRAPPRPRAPVLGPRPAPPRPRPSAPRPPSAYAGAAREESSRTPPVHLWPPPKTGLSRGRSGPPARRRALEWRLSTALAGQE